ncbi:MAG: DUF2958 domain-containing protein [Phycisphaerales bacterium]
MKLLTAELRRRLPPLRSAEREEDPIVQAKFFTPWSDWTWYVLEFDGEDLFFGLVDGFEVELGYFSLGELESLRGPGGLTIERDRHFEPKPLSEVRREIEGDSIEDVSDSERAEDERVALNLIEHSVLANQSSLIDVLIRGELPEGFGYDALPPDDREIYEWWLIDSRLAEELRSVGEHIVDNDYGTWWGRSCTGQAIKMDGTMQEIAARMRARLR